jgi:dihydropteroate synthase
MGILNLTPDSFSDGGQVVGVEQAMARAREMVRAGADLVDVGGESTRPGATPVGVREELDRVLPFLREASARLEVPLSIDTRRAAVADAALEAGARIVNDVSGLLHDPSMAAVVAQRGAGVVLMHMRGEPADMMERASYRDLIAEVREELAAAVERALRAGVTPERVVVDPGLGFAKTPEQSLALLGRLGELGSLGFPVLVGPSRKRFLGRVLGVPPAERAVGTAAACVLAYLQGARVFRVHDVEPVAQALAVAHAVAEAHPLGEGAGGAETDAPGDERTR